MFENLTLRRGEHALKLEIFWKHKIYMIWKTMQVDEVISLS